MVRSQAAFQVDRTWALATLASLMALGTFGLVRGLAWATTPWARDRLGQMPSTTDVRTASTGLVSNLTALAFAALSVMVILGGWIALVRLLGLDPYFAKTPGDVWAFLISGPNAAANRAEMTWPLIVTLFHATIGLAAGFAAGTAMACAAKMWPAVDRAFSPYLVMVSAIPVAAMIPLIALALGRGLGAVTAVVALLTFFPTLVNVMTGLSAAPQQASDVVHVAGGSQRQTLTKVFLPFSVPWLFAALRIAAPNAIGSALVAEWLITGDGMARYMQSARSAGDFTAVWSSGVVLMVVSFLAYGLVARAEDHVMRRRNGVERVVEGGGKLGRRGPFRASTTS
jgi:ABC-type nitrate/sulfonate/bicarbonate transport system permease component